MARRTMMTALPATTVVGAAAAQPAPILDADVAFLVSLSAQANAALMRGDIATYRSLLSFADDFSFISPFGGKPSRRADLTDERIEAMGSFFRHGDFSQEVVETHISGNLAVLVLIERQRVEVGELPMQDWLLRVTLVYQRSRAGEPWRLAHRHADPLTAPLGMQTAAALARGAGSALSPHSLDASDQLRQATYCVLC